MKKLERIMKSFQIESEEGFVKALVTALAVMVATVTYSLLQAF